jgi:hypothetical protein
MYIFISLLKKKTSINIIIHGIIRSYDLLKQTIFYSSKRKEKAYEYNIKKGKSYKQK